MLFILTVGGRSQERGSELDRLFQIGLSRADVAILLDASLSMRNHRYVEVRQAVVDFTSSLPHDTTLSLRIFGDIAGAPLEGPADKIAGNVAEHLPAQPLFQNTDLGLAILKSLEFLERSNASDAQALLLITDGLHEPPPGSIFSRRFASDPNWQSLRRRASELCSTRQLMVFGLGLGERTDVALLQQVFPTTNVELITGNAMNVMPALRRIRESMRAARLRRALESELTEGRIVTLAARNEIGITDREFVEPITIRNDYRRLPVVIDRIDLTVESSPAEDVTFELDETQGITLAPGQQWQGSLRGSLITNQPVLSVGRHERGYQSAIRISPVVRFQHRDEIAQSGIQTRHPFATGLSIRVEFRERYGVPYWIICGAMLVGLGFILLVRRRRKISARRIAAKETRLSERRRITGEIKIWLSDKPEPDEGGFDAGVNNPERLRLVQASNGNLEIAPSDEPGIDIVACISGRISGARPNDPESGRVEFSLEVERGHRLAYETGGEWRETTRITLCDRDLILIDGRWKMRYSNHRLRSRAELESARPTEPRA
ncbi:MAG: VWA domain-containing protein [Acidobacteriota bacterium]|nr:MAG: VWA domain-containing protein [Acidobacteriota bacterium]